MFQPFLSWLGFPPLACANWFAVCVMLVIVIVQYVDQYHIKPVSFKTLLAQVFRLYATGYSKGRYATWLKHQFFKGACEVGHGNCRHLLKLKFPSLRGFRVNNLPYPTNSSPT